MELRCVIDRLAQCARSGEDMLGLRRGISINRRQCVADIREQAEFAACVFVRLQERQMRLDVYASRSILKVGFEIKP